MVQPPKTSPPLAPRARELWDHPEISAVFERVSAMTGMIVVLQVAPTFDATVRHRERRACHQFFRQNPCTGAYCQMAQERLWRKGFRQKDWFEQECPYGITTAVKALRVNGEVLAFLTVGRVFIGQPNWEKHHRTARRCGLDEAGLMNALDEMPVASMELFHRTLDFIDTVVSLVVRRIELQLKVEALEERIQSEVQSAQLRQRGSKLTWIAHRAIMSGVREMVWLRNPSGFFLTSNRSFGDFIGISMDRFGGSVEESKLPPETLERFRVRDLEAIEAGKAVRHTEEFRFASDGHTELLEVVRTPLYEDGEPFAVLSVASGACLGEGSNDEITPNRRA